MITVPQLTQPGVSCDIPSPPSAASSLEADGRHRQPSALDLHNDITSRTLDDPPSLFPYSF